MPAMSEEEKTPETTTGEGERKKLGATTSLAIVAVVLAIVGSIVIVHGRCGPSPKPPADAASVAIDAAPAADAAAMEADAPASVDAAQDVVDAAPAPAIDAAAP